MLLEQVVQSRYDPVILGLRVSPSIPGLNFQFSADQDAVLVTTYTAKAEFNVTYYKSVPLIPGATICADAASVLRAELEPAQINLDNAIPDVRT